MTITSRSCRPRARPPQRRSGLLAAEVVPNPAGDRPVRISAREFHGIGTGVRVWRTIGIPLEGNCGNGDHRPFGKPLLEVVKSRLAFGQTKPPAIVVDDDADMVRVVESRHAAIEGGFVEGPLRRRELPDELRKIARMPRIAGPAAFGGEIVLVPPFELGLRQQGHLANRLAADQVAAHRYHGLAALRPEGRHDVGRPRAPIAAGDDRFLNSERPSAP